MTQERTGRDRSADKTVRRCTIYFGIFAFVAAGLIGLGQQSWNLPMLVGSCVVVSFIYTDWLGWFSLPRPIVYVSMIAGAGIAILQFLGDLSANQLLAVRNLLVYVQLPLIFQHKSKRVFEQWGVFLLLELVVAALVNDNVLYGLLMLPVLGVGCAAMMSLAQYASNMKHSESITESTSRWAQWMHWMGRETSIINRSSGIAFVAVQSTDALSSMHRRMIGASWRASVLPLAACVLLFSVFYFYSLPRLQVGAYEAESWFAARVGFSEQVSLRYHGDIRQNETPMFRMSFFDAKTNREYRPNQPPYIRLTVLHRYLDGPDRGVWQKGESGLIVDPRVFRAMPKQHEIEDTMISQSDPVVVSIIEKSSLGEPVPVIPPFSQTDTIKGMNAIRRDWRLIDTSDDARGRSLKRRFTFRTYGFSRGNERAMLPDLHDCLEFEDNGEVSNDSMNLYRRGELTDFPASLSPILPFRDKIFASGTSKDKLSKALMLEYYLANNPDFEYSLRIMPPVNSRLDPIADFLLNKRKGHCEYFASSLAMLLRSMNIPTRIVSGFRPSDYNELGGYFLVQQKHAHVWVEAYFTLEELKSKTLAEPIPDWVTTGMWLRFDPTPAGEGSNAGGTFRASNGQTLDVMQDLWTEMVLNMDKSRQSGMLSLFAESSEGSYASIWLQIQTIVTRLQTSRFIGGLLSPDRWFSWQAAVGIIVAGAGFVVIYKVLLWLFPHWMPRFTIRRSRKNSITKIEFYNQAIKALKRLGLERRSWQTPQEFMRFATSELQSRQWNIDCQLLATLFYDCRYSGNPHLSPEAQIQATELIKRLEAGRP